MEKLKSSESASQRFLPPMLGIALILGVLVHLAGFLFFQVVSSPLPDRQKQKPLIRYLSNETFSGDLELEEQAILFDSAPLFLPTKWSASSQIFRIKETEPLIFPEFEPVIDLLDDLEPLGSLVKQAHTVVAPEDLLASRYWNFFDSFARDDSRPVALQSSAPFAEIRPLEPVGGAGLIVPVKIGFEFDVLIDPVELLVRVDHWGHLTGQPYLVASSGDGDFDQAVTEWLKDAAEEAQLPAGYLSVRVFP